MTGRIVTRDGGSPSEPPRSTFRLHGAATLGAAILVGTILRAAVMPQVPVTSASGGRSVALQAWDGRARHDPDGSSDRDCPW
jgi:hypothetical protein